MDITQYTNPLEQFRTSLYQNFTNQADTLMELVDAMCSQPEARSVAEYSLSPYFRRSYSMLYKAIDVMELEPLWLAEQLKPYLPRPKAWPFWLLLVDVTPTPRPYAYTLADRGMVYQPEVVKGKLPVTIGHQYSTVALGLEPEAGISASWVLPLMTARVATDQDKELVGMAQIELLLKDERLPFGKELTVEVADSSYSKPESLYAHRKYPNVVTIASNGSSRLRSSNGTLAALFATLAHRPARPNPGIFRQGGQKARLCPSVHDILSSLRANPRPQPPDYYLRCHYHQRLLRDRPIQRRKMRIDLQRGL